MFQRKSTKYSDRKLQKCGGSLIRESPSRKTDLREKKNPAIRNVASKDFSSGRSSVRNLQVSEGLTGKVTKNRVGCTLEGHSVWPERNREEINLRPFGSLHGLL